MQQQSFIAPNISAALLLVKETLGADAVILSTERQPGGNIKITAGIDDGVSVLPATKPKAQTEQIRPQSKPLDIELIRKGLEYHGILSFVSNKILTEVQKEAAKNKAAASKTEKADAEKSASSSSADKKDSSKKEASSASKEPAKNDAGKNEKESKE